MEWTKKRIRIAIGLVMYGSFLFLALQINFLFEVGFLMSRTIDTPYIILALGISMSFIYLPSVALIILTYVLLTRVYKYEKEVKK